MEKYYIPNVKDIFVGYECEVTTCGFREGDWHNTDDVRKAELMGYEIREVEWENLWIRTLYLTKEQIEAEGWEFDKEENLYQMSHDHGVYHLRYYKIPHYIPYSISIWDFFNAEFIYQGNCPSINEFRKIVSLLNIK